MRVYLQCTLRSLTLGVFSSLVVLWMVPPAGAAEPEGGCAPPFDLRTLEEMTAFAPNFASNLMQADLNDDGWLCIKFDKHTPTVFTFTDNRRQGRGRP